jgi:hypothetical protein
MAVTAHWYGPALKNLALKKLDLSADTIKVMLCTSTYTPDQDHEYKSSVTNEVANGNGYTTGGAALANKALTYDAANNAMKFDADDTVWAASTITARYAVIYDETSGGSDATRCLLGYVDFGADVTSTNGNFTITWDATGILRATAS